MRKSAIIQNFTSWFKKVSQTKVMRFLAEHKTTTIFVLVLVISATLHGVNMFKYPYIESDEGTYVVQAWSVETDGIMTPYTYWYDHPPVGWYTIGAWMDFLGGDWNLFGSSIHNGRVLMLVLHLIRVSLVMYIVKRATKSTLLAAMTGLLLSVPIMAVFFQRRILLDNIMSTWLLGSIAILFKKKVNLTDSVTSGLLYGLAFLSKITAVTFGPAILYHLLTSKNIDTKRHFGVLGWIASAASLGSMWLLYALIKGEFFAPTDDSRVSLLGTLAYQSSRGSDVPFYDFRSSLMVNIAEWFALDPAYMTILTASLVASIFLTIFSKRYRFFGIGTLGFVLFLIRGGIVINFYVLTLLPFAMMAFVTFLDDIVRRIFKKRREAAITALFIALLIGIGIYTQTGKVQKYLTSDETSNQLAAAIWVKENLPEDAVILADITMMTELLNPEFVNDKVFTNTDWYYKVAKDPAIRFEKYNDTWRSFDYVYMSHEMIYQTGVNKLPVVIDVLRNARPVKVWQDGTTAFVDIVNLISTNGDWAAVFKVNGTTETQLRFSWNSYKEQFLKSYGQIVDPATDITTSEGQAYAMLQAVWANDEDAFKGVWAWAQDHFQFRIQDRLLSWAWKDDKQLDPSNATDADLDAALALLFAAKQFDKPQYKADALELIDAIWNQTVVRIGRRYYLLPTEKKAAERGESYLLNPSYFSPAHYAAFAEVDPNPDHDWNALIDDTYEALERIDAWTGSRYGLVPNWLMINKNTGAFSSGAPYIQSSDSELFGFDAFRIMWRVALDEAWYAREAASAYLAKAAPFFEREWERRRNFSAIYTTSGTRVVRYSSKAFAAGVLPALKNHLPGETVSDIYTTVFEEQYTEDEEREIAYWGDPANYYDASWNFLGLALYHNDFPNILE